MSQAEDKLRRLLGDPALLSLRHRLRRHYERRHEGETPRFVRLGALAVAEQDALALLMGRRPLLATSIRLDIPLIDAKLRDADLAGSLREALEILDGPIVNRAVLVLAARNAWLALTEHTDRSARLLSWLKNPAALTLLKRLTRSDVLTAEKLLTRAEVVLNRLPAIGLTRARLAAQTLGNAHALDAGQPVASVVLSVWRATNEIPESPSDRISEASKDAQQQEQDDVPDDSTEAPLPTRERIRDLWANAGVLVNELARPALILNLPVAETSPTVWTPGEPSYLSLRQLLRTPPVWDMAGKPVFVCENPNLLSIAADELGAQCAPLVCTDGMPAAAQRTLLDQLSGAGAHLYYHGDFDWAGIDIANFVIRRWSAKPWRMAASHYLAAVGAAPEARHNLGKPGSIAVWDPLLAPAMLRNDWSIDEEAVADDLLEDLRPSLHDRSVRADITGTARIGSAQRNQANQANQANHE